MAGYNETYYMRLRNFSSLTPHLVVYEATDNADSEVIKTRKIVRWKPSPVIALLLLSVGLNCIGVWMTFLKGASKDDQFTYCKCLRKMNDNRKSITTSHPWLTSQSTRRKIR